MPGPCAYKFQTEQNKYVYDLNTNNIIRVDEVIFGIIGDYLTGLFEKNEAEHKACFGADRVDKAVADIEELKGLDCFRRSDNETVEKPYCPECLQVKYETQLMQLVLEATEACNLRCRYCTYSGNYKNQRSHSHKMMSFATARKAIDYHYAHSSKTEQPIVSFYGGEPMMNKSVVLQSIEYAKSLPDWRDRLMITVDSNGTLIDDATLDYFMKNEVSLQLSIDGPEDIHDANRISQSGKGSWRKVDDLLQKIHERDRFYFDNRVIISCTLAPPYRLCKINDYFTQGRNHSLNVNSGFVERSGIDLERIFGDDLNRSDLYDDLNSLKENYMQQMFKAKRFDTSRFILSLYESPVINLLRRRKDKMGDEIPPNGICKPGTRKLYVSVNGDLYPCEKCGMSFCIGHVDRGIDMRIVTKLMDDYAQMCEKLCHKCWAARLCSMCYVVGKGDNGLSVDARMKECKLEKGIIHNALVDVARITEQNPKSLEFIKEMTFA